MNDVNDALANWEALLREIHEDDLNELDLSDKKADLYDFCNELEMRPLRERLLEALQTNWTDPDENRMEQLGNLFFATMNEQQQRNFFRTILALQVPMFILGKATDNGTEKPAITIHTSALLDALADLNSFVSWLEVQNFALSNQSDVTALANIIVAKRETLEFDTFELSARRPPYQSSLVSTNAVRVLFGAGRRLETLRLHGLGLNDSHCHAIAEELQILDMFVGTLNLCLNPAISAQGYGALLGLINRVINRVDVIYEFRVDNTTWEAALNLVPKMNRDHGRLEYMTDGVFSSEERRWQWLKKLASLPTSSDEEDAKQVVNFIWYELLEYPEIMQT